MADRLSSAETVPSVFSPVFARAVYKKVGIRKFPHLIYSLAEFAATARRVSFGYSNLCRTAQNTADAVKSTAPSVKTNGFPFPFFMPVVLLSKFNFYLYLYYVVVCLSQVYNISVGFYE